MSLVSIIVGPSFYCQLCKIRRKYDNSFVRSYQPRDKLILRIRNVVLHVKSQAFKEQQVCNEIATRFALTETAFLHLEGGHAVARKRSITHEAIRMEIVNTIMKIEPVQCFETATPLFASQTFLPLF